MELSCSYVALFAKRQSFELVSTAKNLDTEDATAYIYKQINAVWSFRSRRIQGQNFLRYTFSRQGSNVWSGEPGKESRPGAILGVEFDVQSEYFLALPDFVEGFVALFDNACKGANDFPFFLSPVHEYQPRFSVFRDIDPPAVLKWLNNALKTADETRYSFSGLRMRHSLHVKTEKGDFYTCSSKPSVLLSHFYSHSSIEIRAAEIRSVATPEVPVISPDTVESLVISAKSGRTDELTGTKSVQFNLIVAVMFGVVCILSSSILWQLYAQSKRLAALEDQIRMHIEYSKKLLEDIGTKASNSDSNKINTIPSSVETGTTGQVKDNRSTKGDPVSSQKKNNPRNSGAPVTSDADRVRR